MQRRSARVALQRTALACAVVSGTLGSTPAEAATDARLNVSVVPAEGHAGVQVRVRRSDGSEPDLIWSGTSQPAPYRLALAWTGRASLEQPVPAADQALGPLQSVELQQDGDRARLELQLREPVIPRLRRIGNAWVLQLDPDPAAAASDRAHGGEPLLLDLTVNGVRQANIARAELTPQGQVLIASESWQEARLLPRGEAGRLGDGSAAFALDAVPGLRYRMDRANMSLAVDAPPQAFQAASLGRADPAMAQPPSRPEPGVVVNYDASVAKAGSTGATGGATLEAIGFGPFGSVVASGVGRDTGTERNVGRLETYWRYDMPHRMETLVVGDTVGVGGAWSRPVRFGGLKWGRDFSMRPGFVTMPQPSLRGEATVPSTVDVLVNNARRVSQQVQPGPFDVPNVPVVAGAGEVNLVVRDLLGRESVVTQSYYSTPRLLAPGLTDFSAEAGWLRTGFGQDSHYGAPFAAGTLRRGITPGLTVEGRLEAQHRRQAAGVELAGLLGTWGAARLAIAHSSSSLRVFHESGQTLQAGLERTTPRGGFALQYEQATRGFAPLGESTEPGAEGQRLRRQWSATLGGQLWGSVHGGINFLRQDRWDGDKVSSLGLSLGFPVGSASVTVSLMKRLDDGSWSGGLFLNVPLENELHAGARAEWQRDGSLAASASAARNAPAGAGLGWRVEASTDQSQRARGSLQYNGAHAVTTADMVSDARGNVDARVGARGSVGIAGGMPFASRPMGDGSFAVVEVPGVAGVPVKLSNQVVAETDTRGRAFVPGLLPWQKNQIEIDPADLPLDVEVAETKREIVPYARSGSVVRFEAERSRQALLVLRQPGARPVPAGASVRLVPGGQEFPVALRGEAWLENLAADKQRVEVRWAGGSCDLELALPAGEPGVPARLGPLLCGPAGAR